MLYYVKYMSSISANNVSEFPMRDWESMYIVENLLSILSYPCTVYLVPIFLN